MAPEVPIIKAALALHRNMATFAQAGVDGGAPAGAPS